MTIIFWFTLLIIATIIDLRTFTIPNWLTLGGITMILLLETIRHQTLPLTLLLSALSSFILMLLLSLLSRGKLGMGDVKFSALISLQLGFYYWLISLFVASLSGLFVAVFCIFYKKMDKNTPIPFAPFLSFGAVMALLLSRGGYFAL